jgi:hypothetical protein
VVLKKKRSLRNKMDELVVVKERAHCKACPSCEVGGGRMVM